MSDEADRWIHAALLRKPQLVKDADPQDDAVAPDGYAAARRVRTYQPADLIFRTHRGAAQAFPWPHLRTWSRDNTGRRMTFAWAEALIVLTGRHLELLEEDLARRIVAELRQVAPGQADTVPAGLPMIETMEITPLGSVADGAG